MVDLSTDSGGFWERFCSIFEAKKVPLRLRFALLKEIAAKRRVRLKGPHFQTNYVDQDCGLRQGSPESALLFAALINLILQNLHDT